MRRSLSVLIPLLLALTVAAAAPARAAESTPSIPTTVPCPLTTQQVAEGKAVVAAARETLDRAVLVADVRPRVQTPASTTVTLSSSTFAGAVESCALALENIQRKQTAVERAYEDYQACILWSMVTGDQCVNQMNNLMAAVNDLEFALVDLRRTCPWIAIF